MTSPTTTRTATPTPRPAGRRWPGALTGVLHLLALAPYAISSLVVADAAYGAMIALWLAFGVAAVLVHRRWGGLSAAVPGAAVLTWFAVLSVLDAAGIANG